MIVRFAYDVRILLLHSFLGHIYNLCVIIKTVGMLCKHTSIIINYSVFSVHDIGVCSRKILDERFFGVNAGLPKFSLSNLREFIFLRGGGGGGGGEGRAALFAFRFRLPLPLN